jgi:hypothetical protein
MGSSNPIAACGTQEAYSRAWVMGGGSAYLPFLADAFENTRASQYSAWLQSSEIVVI